MKSERYVYCDKLLTDKHYGNNANYLRKSMEVLVICQSPLTFVAYVDSVSSNEWFDYRHMYN